MTLIYTAELHGENPFHYLTALLQHADAVAAAPAEWVPWRYRETLAGLMEREPRCRDPARAPAPTARTARSTALAGA